MIDLACTRGLSSGLDLGYGMGNHTLAMLEAGLRVLAVDQVPPRHLKGMVAARGLDGEKVTIRQCLLEDYFPEADFGLVIAKDVLHYLSRVQIERILKTLIDRAASANLHHLEVFCDIWRITGAGTPVAIEAEANYHAPEFISLVQRLYRHWNLDITQEPHVERDTASERPYFTATRVVVTASRPQRALADSKQQGSRV